MNHYNYVIGDPVNFSDRFGLCPQDTSVRVSAWNTNYLFTTIYICRDNYSLLPGAGNTPIVVKYFCIRPMTVRDIYESGACTTVYGIPCYEEELLKLNLVEGIQLVLDLAGLVPGFGEVADLANALISAARGDGASAVMSLVAMVPIGGQLATAAKLTRRGLMEATGKTAEEVMGQHAHHIYPRKFADVWERNRINWDSAGNGAWWEAWDHLRNAYQYNRDWENWITRNAGILGGTNNAFAQQAAKEFAEELRKKYAY
ncbi:MAG: hypothetical protein FJW30_21810 [Acidobacteria bacterium]|nr:hypothetical protein [Acidobacteriota bacterium]